MAGVTTRSIEHEGERFHVVDDQDSKVLTVTETGGAVMRINYKAGFQVVTFLGAGGGEAPSHAVQRLVRVHLSGVLQRYDHKAGSFTRGGMPPLS